MNQIIVATEKHGTYYWDASTPEVWATSALAILTERFNLGYWYMTPDEAFDDESEYAGPVLSKLVPGWADKFYGEGDEEGARQVITAYKRDVIEAIPDEDARQMVAGKLSKAINREKQKIRYAREFKELKRIVDEQDAGFAEQGRRLKRQVPKAWLVLQARDGHEYEGVTLENVHTAGEEGEEAA